MSNQLTDHRAIKILFSNFFLRSARIIYYVFLNVYIWKNTQDIQLIAIFNLIYVTTHIIWFFIAAPFAKKGYNKLLHFISIFWLTLLYLSVLILGDNLIDYLLLFSAIMWFFNGIYWINYHLVQFEVTNFHNRWNFAWLKTALVQISTIVIPSVIGFLITYDIYWYWYQSAFLLSAIMLVLSLYFWNITIPVSKDTKWRFNKISKIALSDIDIKKSLFSYWLTGFSFWNTLLEVIIWIYLFNFLWKEDQLGYTLSFIGILAIFGLYAFWKFIDYKDYKKSFVIIGILYTLTLLLFITFNNFWVVLIAASFIKIFQNLFSIPQKVVSDNIGHKIENYKQYRSEYIVLREVFLYLGWIASFWLLYFIWSIEIEKMKYLFLLIVVFLIMATYMLSKIDITKIENK